ncbi:MAG: delta-60 repeat domain-containing protein [Solirubrobacterales bacterium]|nr:delta-60 repeat domain-containing protein [Solirubrobacterales bacterium]
MNRSRSLTVLLALCFVGLAPNAASAAYGDLDADFGVGGKVRGLALSEPSEIQIQPDRKILVGGRMTSNLGAYSGRIARLGRSGELDNSFGTGGYVAIPGGGLLFDMDLLDDGRIAALVSDNKIVVFRTDGSLDAGFGTGGVLSFGNAPTSMKAASIAPQSGAKILVSGGSEQKVTTSLLG